jgi:hypothetical protein
MPLPDTGFCGHTARSPTRGLLGKYDLSFEPTFFAKPKFLKINIAFHHLVKAKY